MPYDGDPQKFETPAAEPDVFSIEGLIAWLEKQPPETEYDYDDCDGGCLLGRYLIAHGQNPKGAYGSMSKCAGTTGSYGAGLIGCCVAVPYPHVYGAALKRARKLLAERNG